MQRFFGGVVLVKKYTHKGKVEQDTQEGVYLFGANAAEGG